ncbi:helix-turn-helix domain-containing protein [Pseudomonas japonica]|uniref:helix-turn-helix domain-containing protein n=1 Tax=Pseudomonas japonica TaxID=256466 RepID=UPI0015E40C42|nr:AraC family transcriptional regulator [Pseudomonas japonica]MBA1290126.1 helix-turn-helix transcriptional regulator [Pseudomonas japonica]
MKTLHEIEVFEALRQSPHARLEQRAGLGDGLVAAVWNNRNDARHYQGPGHHTLSCYLAGGTGTHRRERPQRNGAPGKLCVLPAGHDSAWVINGPIRLAHLYFSEEQLALGCIALFDREPRALALNERTFVDDAEQARRFARLVALDWNEPAERLLTSSLAHEMLGHALHTQIAPRKVFEFKGGLAPAQRRHVLEYIEANLAAPLSLGELAAVCCLSEFHFARMFRLSLGVPPHRFVLARRIAMAKRLLADRTRLLADISLACGFASSSHFSTRFSQAVGVAPAAYRAALGTPTLQ